MKSPDSHSPENQEQDLEALVRNLRAAEEALQNSAGDDVDAVFLGDGRTYLLNKAREAIADMEGQKNLLAAIVESSEDAIYSEALDETVLSWNHGAEKIFGYTATEMIGSNFIILVPPEEQEKYRRVVNRIQQGEQIQHYEAPRLRKDGKRIWVSLSIFPLKNEAGEIVGISKIVRDITERKVRDEELSLKERALQEISQGVLITDENRGTLYVNPTFEKLSGYSLGEVIGRNCKFLQGPDSDPKIIKKISLALRSGESFQGEILNYRKDGTTFWNDLTISPIRDESGRLTRFIGIQRDVTERKNVENQLYKTLELTKMANSAAKMGAWAVEYPGSRVLWSDEIYCIHEVEPDYEPELESALSFYPPKDRAILSKALEKGEPFDLELQFITAKGKPLWVRTTCSVERSNGELRRIFGIFQDITEKKVAENRFGLLVNSNVQSIFFWNTNGEITDSNDAFLKLVGYTREELETGLINWAAMTPPEYADLDRHALQEIAIHRVCTPYEKEWIRKDGSRVPILIGAAVFQDTPDNGVCFVVDVTPRKQIEIDLKKALDEQKGLTRMAQAAVEAKSQFLAVMSHEIRTPMNGILGFAELLATESGLSPQAHEHLQAILKSGENLLHIIDDILDFSRIDAGKIRIENAPFPINELLQDLVGFFETSIKEKGLEFRFSVDPSLPPKIIGDSGRIRQILINLIGNALKFTNSGSITLNLLHSKLHAKDHVNFSVEDTGIGITTENQGKIFEAFTQADSTISRRYGGSGLGLTISQHLAQLMGGVLELKSQPGKGSVFSLFIPLERIDKIVSPAAGKEQQLLTTNFAAQYPLKILVVDDNHLNLRLVIAMLQKLGYEPLKATNGLETLQIYKESHPHCILMDVQMPVMNGIEATKQIRAMEKAAALPAAYISALTANILPEDRRRCHKAGMDAFLNKPMKVQQIADLLIQASLKCSNSYTA